MRFIFLGTGTSPGIPAIACDCPVCTSTDPHDRRLRTSAALRFTDPAGQDRTVLLDAGPDLRQQALTHKLRRCDAIFFTHNHVDHTFGLDEVRRFNVVMDAPIDIYAERRTLDDLRRVYRHIFESPDNFQQSFVASIIAHEIRPGEPIDLFGLRFTPIRLLHGRLPIVGYRIERAEGAGTDGGAGGEGGVLPLVYCTDVSSIPPESWRYLSGASNLILDALRHRHHPTHQTVSRAVEVAQQAGADRTWLIHMSHDVSHAETQALLPEGIALAYDGLVLEE